MHRANSDPSTRNKSSENRGSVAAGEDEMSHSEHPTGIHVWATLLNTITNIQPPLVTSHSSEVRMWTHDFVLNCSRNNKRTVATLVLLTEKGFSKNTVYISVSVRRLNQKIHFFSKYNWLLSVNQSFLVSLWLKDHIFPWGWEEIAQEGRIPLLCGALNCIIFSCLYFKFLTVISNFNTFIFTGNYAMEGFLVSELITLRVWEQFGMDCPASFQMPVSTGPTQHWAYDSSARRSWGTVHYLIGLVSSKPPTVNSCWQ